MTDSSVESEAGGFGPSTTLSLGVGKVVRGEGREAANEFIDTFMKQLPGKSSLDDMSKAVNEAEAGSFCLETLIIERMAQLAKEDLSEGLMKAFFFGKALQQLDNEKVFQQPTYEGGPPVTAFLKPLMGALTEGELDEFPLIHQVAAVMTLLEENHRYLSQLMCMVHDILVKKIRAPHILMVLASVAQASSEESPDRGVYKALWDIVSDGVGIPSGSPAESQESRQNVH